MARPVKMRLVGKTYRIKEVHPSSMPGSLGECDHPKDRKKEIRVDKTLFGREKLEVMIHEALHACDYFKSSEKWVNAAARDISILLWKKGYRQSKKRYN